jgi:tetratricopeptide (TPR) repeat protein
LIQTRAQKLIFGAAGLMLLAIYVAATAPGVFWRDSLEFSLIGHFLDIGHPAGSPVFSLLAKVLSFAPLGGLAWRANWLSALTAVVAVLLLWRAVFAWVRALDLAGQGSAFWSGGLAALTFAFSQSFWAWSEVAEVYSLQVAALAGLLWLAAPALANVYDLRRTGLIGLLLGLSCGIHMVQLLYAPAFGVVLLFVSPYRVRWRAAVVMGAAFVVGFSVFTYLPIRSLADLPYDHGNPETWSAFIAHITGRRYSAVIHSFPWAAMLINIARMPVHFWHEIGPLPSLAALAGGVALAIRGWRPLALLGLIVAGHFYLYIKDWAAAFGYIPIYLLASLLAGVGAAWLAGLVERQESRAGWFAPVAVAMMAVISAASGLVSHAGYINRTEHDLAQRHGRAILDSLPTGAALVGFQDHLAYNVFYQQSIERWRDDVTFLHRAWLPFPDEVARRAPSWDLSRFNPADPTTAEATLRDNAGEAGAFWDYGWETAPWVRPTHLAPHGLVFRILPEPWDGSASPMDARLMDAVFAPIYRSRLVAPQGSDWTAQEVYARAFHLRAKVHADAGRWEAARRAETQALELRPDFAESYAFLGLIHAAQGRNDLAFNNLNRAIELDGVCGVCLAARGQFRLRMQEKAGALEDLSAAYELSSGDATTNLVLARLLLEAGNSRRAVEVLEQTRRLPLPQEQQTQTTALLASVFAARRDCERVNPLRTELKRLAPEHPSLPGLQDACGPGENL